MSGLLTVADLATTTPLSMVGNIGCPFCGKTHLSIITPKDPGSHAWVCCETCGATGPQGLSTQAEALWNVRAFGPEIFIRPEDCNKLA